MEFSRDDYDSIFDEKHYDIKDPINCKHNYVLIDGLHTCIRCGEIDIHKIAFIELSHFYRGYSHI